MNGIIEAFNQQKGYGFISSNGDDYFFHISDWITPQTLPELGMDVKFDVTQSQKGLKAVKVSFIMSTPRFIALQNDRIKFSNIMHYGIDTIEIQFNCNQTIIEKASQLKLLNDIIIDCSKSSILIRDMITHINFYQDFFQLNSDPTINNIIERLESLHFLLSEGSLIFDSRDKVGMLIHAIESYGFILDDVKKYKNIRYLYVETYQKQTYTYNECESFSIDEKLKELDSFFIGTEK